MRPLSPVLASVLLAHPIAAWAQDGRNDADALAKALANPGGSNATLNVKLEYRTFAGDVTGSDEQSATTLTFQPVFPFKLRNGDSLIFRPAISYVWDQPTISFGRFSATRDFGDLAFDVLYSKNVEGKTIGYGMVGSVPTGRDLSSDNWLLGPSFLYVQPTDWGIWGLFPFHNQKVGGSGPEISLTSLQYFLFYGLGDGWLIGTGPTITYDWETDARDAWTVPHQLSASKTTQIGKLPIKLSFSVEKNVVAPDAFAEDWTFAFTFSPVISNPLQRNPPRPRVQSAARSAPLTSHRKVKDEV